MAHADTLLYNAVKVLTEDPATRAFLEAYDPKALAQAREAVRTFDEEHATTVTKEFAVDLFIPFSAVVPVEDDGADADHLRAEAETLARNTFYAENLYPLLCEALRDTVFGPSDSEWIVNVGDTE